MHVHVVKLCRAKEELGAGSLQRRFIMTQGMYACFVCVCVCVMFPPMFDMYYSCGYICLYFLSKSS